MIDANTLRSRLSYDPDTGIFRWLLRDGDKWFNARFAGMVAGNLTSYGYISINFDHQPYQAHRLAWLHYYGNWPEHTIDHLDHDRANNAIRNLADVPTAINNKNKKQRIGQSGCKGVQPRDGRWVAVGQYQGKRLHFGTFGTVEEASAAYQTGMQNADSTLAQRPHLKDHPKQQRSDQSLTHEMLLAKVQYDPATGRFFKVGKSTEIGNITTGYRRIGVNGRRYSAHTLAVFYMTARWPTGVIDHINGNKLDNRWTNLREVNQSRNALNTMSRPMRGIRPTRNKIKRWEAAITVSGQRIHLGTFDTEVEAREAWSTFVTQNAILVRHPVSGQVHGTGWFAVQYGSSSTPSSSTPLASR